MARQGINEAGLTTIGLPASFEFTAGQLFGQPYVPTVTGSELGAPPVDAIAGETATPGKSAASYGRAKSGQGPTHQPVFWLIVLVVLGVILLSHTAKLSLRG